jgi:serine/threonine protein kinase
MIEQEFGKKIGEGAFGAVFLDTWNGVDVAIMTPPSCGNDKAWQELEHEAFMMTMMPFHPHILSFVGAAISDDKLSLVAFFSHGGSLDKALLRQ